MKKLWVIATILLLSACADDPEAPPPVEERVPCDQVCKGYPILYVEEWDAFRCDWPADVAWCLAPDEEEM